MFLLSPFAEFIINNTNFNLNKYKNKNQYHKKILGSILNHKKKIEKVLTSKVMEYH